MTSISVSLRRRLPKRLRGVGLRLLGRRPAAREVERSFELALPGNPPRSLAIRTPRRTYVSRLLETSGLAGYEPDTLACFLAGIDENGFAPV